MTAIGIATSTTSIIILLSILILPIPKNSLDECILAAAIVFCAVALAHHLVNATEETERNT